MLITRLEKFSIWTNLLNRGGQDFQYVSSTENSRVWSIKSPVYLKVNCYANNLQDIMPVALYNE